MKILMLSHVHKDWYAGAAGTSLHIAEELRKLGDDITILWIDDLIPNLSKVTGRIRNRIVMESIPLIVLYRIKKILWQYDVVEATSTVGFLLFKYFHKLPHRPILSARTYGLEHVDEIEMNKEWRLGNTDFSRFHRLTSSILLHEVSHAIRYADVFVCLAEQDKKLAITEEWKEAKEILVSGTGYSSSFYHPHNYSINHRNLNILWWASWITRKGIDYAVPALTQILKEFPTQCDVNYRWIRKTRQSSAGKICRGYPTPDSCSWTRNARSTLGIFAFA